MVEREVKVKILGIVNLFIENDEVYVNLLLIVNLWIVDRES